MAVFAALAAAADEPAPPPDPPPGQLLIASAAIVDPRFHHAVILLLGHDAKGAFGLIINRPLGERRLADLLRDSGADSDEAAGVEGEVRVFFGGPVQPASGFVVHSADYRRPETLTVGGLAMTASKDVLRDIGHHNGPAKYLLALGYAGWGAGQLDAEVARRDWFTAPVDSDLVFDLERNLVWQKALARRSREL